VIKIIIVFKIDFNNVSKYINYIFIGVVALDGLLYVFGGDIDRTFVDTVEIYNPNTNTWSIEPLSKNRNANIFYAVAVDRPPHL